MQKQKLNLSAPWTTLYREFKALFGDDPEINVLFDEGDAAIKLYVESPGKAEALTKLLPTEKVYGNVTVSITVIPANSADGGVTPASTNVWDVAFAGNPAFAFVHTTAKGLFNFRYVVFKNMVVQFFNDNLADLKGLKSTLFEDIARDIFGDDAQAYFCTDTEGKVGVPLGEWP